ncbi:putative plastidic glucose transporter 2 isoform X2 [Canna indica]|uniref:Plastidic glucose transporter 2 isoform X2 n=1 Tax=Canna indica TaxID=4628 RepID=A0AAQ3Q6I6_9LILI|nr:putative plastidic glucose transporter 2 isoform X2 [Canna indica]
MENQPGLNSVVYKRMPSKDFPEDVERGDDASERFLDPRDQDIGTPSWKLSLSHVCVATISSLFGYHLGVVNLAAREHFAGSWVCREHAGRRTCVLHKLVWWVCGMLLGRFLVGTGMGLGPPVASLYVTEVSPPSVRGTYGSFIQIATCLGLMSALFVGIPVKQVMGWWRVCFWVSSVPAVLLALCMEFCAESPHWLYKSGSSLSLFGLRDSAAASATVVDDPPTLSSFPSYAVSPPSPPSSSFGPSPLSRSSCPASSTIGRSWWSSESS